MGMGELKRTAIVYDYDGTLARGNIQENSFIPEVGMTKEEFWTEVKRLAVQNDADEILVYMQLMLREAGKKHIDVTDKMLRLHGGTSQFFEGLSDGCWFVRMNAFAERHGLKLGHYIVSSGNQEMIEGSLVAKYFDKIFASRYLYNEVGIAEWPGLAINYTSKTQFLFRINKGVDNVWDNKAVNAFMPEPERPVPFSRMIFIGDGDTDIPSMKMTTHNGGHSIATYDPKRDDQSLRKVHSLIADGRVDFVAPADYSANSQMDIVVKGILGRIGRNEGYRPTED